MCAFLCIHTHTYTLLKQVLFTAFFPTHSDLCVSAVHSCGDCVCEKKTIFKNLVLPVFARAETLTFQQKFRCVGVMLA